MSAQEHLPSAAGSSRRASSSPYAAPTCAAHSCCSFVSDFTSDQIKATRDLLTQIHPDAKISSAALIIIMRLQDRLAHYLLERAYYKENSEWARVRGYTFAAPEPIKLRSMTEPIMIGDCATHSILWRFPSHIAPEQLNQFVPAEPIRYAKKLRDDYLTPLTAAEYQKMISSKSVADRWIEDFRTGLIRNANGSSVSQVDLPSEMTSSDARISLFAMIQFITGDLLELAGVRARDCILEWITSITMLSVLSSDDELNELFQFLPIEWSVSDVLQEADRSDVNLLSHAHVGVEACLLPSIDVLMRNEFTFELKSYKTDHQAQDGTSWYNNPQRLRNVAQQLVRDGSIDYSSVALSLQKYHTRPYCHWGENKNESVIDGQVLNGIEQTAACFTYTSVIVRDKADIDWHLLIELAWSESDSVFLGTLYILRSDGDCRSHFCSIGRFEPKPMKYRINIEMPRANQNLIQSIKKSHVLSAEASTSAAIDMGDMTDVKYTPHGFKISTDEEDEMTGTDQGKFSPLDAIGIARIESVVFDSEDEDEEEEERRQNLSATQKEFECIIPHVLHVAMNFETNSSSIYTENQSLTHRRRFTAVLIDESFIHANEQRELTISMPSVLIDLITEYHSFYLPHLAEEMKLSNSSLQTQQQMR